MIALTLATISFAAWLYLMFARGGFWLARERDRGMEPLPQIPPRVVIVVPARNEAENIASSITSLLTQDYPAVSLVLIDDDSSDGTAEVARRTAAALGRAEQLNIVASQALPAGWTGKLWAVKQGIAAAEQRTPDYLMLTDADIVHTRDTVSWLVGHAASHNLVLASLAARWRCENLAERVHIPAFIFFFQMLYPFAWVNRPDHAMAGAAGGCMLVRTQALRAAGGIDAIRDALIDDCALAAELKKQGPIWLGLTDRVQSIRPYPDWDSIRRMVARSAYAQLGYSPLMLVGCLLGMALTYLAAPLLAVFGHGLAQALGAAAFALIFVSYVPILRFYGRAPWWGLALPAIALAYMAFTLDSAYQHGRGRGGLWKGRVQAQVGINTAEPK